MKVSFVGDISISGINIKEFDIDPNIIHLFTQSDLNVGNLENPITKIENPINDNIVKLKIEDDPWELLKYFNVLSICNNHIFDYGVHGFNDTINYLQKHGISYFGAGSNSKNAKQPLQLIINNDQKIAFISGTRWSNAKSNSHGTSSYQRFARILRMLKKEKYFIVYFPHWGYEYITIPPPDVRKHAKKMINLGVDLIIGAHPHIVQGYEKYRNKFIFYSLGNFIFDSKIIKFLTLPEDYKISTISFILELNIISKNEYSFNIIPIEFDNNNIRIISEDNNQMENYLENISLIFNKSYKKYLHEYYLQVPKMIEYSKKIRNLRPNRKKKNIFKHINESTLQGILNRIAYHFMKKR